MTVGEYLTAKQRYQLDGWLWDNGYWDLDEWMEDSDYVYSVEAEEWLLVERPWAHPVDAELTAWAAMEASTSHEEDQQ